MKFCTTIIFAVAAMFCVTSGVPLTKKPKTDEEVSVRFGEVMEMMEHIPIIGGVFGSLQNVIESLSGMTGEFPSNPLEGITGNSPSNPLGLLSGNMHENQHEGMSGESPSMNEGILGESPSMNEGILGESPSNGQETGLPIEGQGLTGNSISGNPGSGGGGGGGGFGGHGLVTTLLNLVDSLLTSLGLNANENGLLTPVLDILNNL